PPRAHGRRKRPSPHPFGPTGMTQPGGCAHPSTRAQAPGAAPPFPEGRSGSTLLTDGSAGRCLAALTAGRDRRGRRPGQPQAALAAQASLTAHTAEGAADTAESTALTPLTALTT